MKHVFATLFLAVALVAQVFAQPASYAPTAKENSLLWEISGKGLEQPSYLFGTIHLIGKEDFILTDITKASFTKTKRVTFEIDMEDMTDISVLMPLMMKAFMSDGSTLRTLLSEEDPNNCNVQSSSAGSAMNRQGIRHFVCVDGKLLIYIIRFSWFGIR